MKFDAAQRFCWAAFLFCPKERAEPIGSALSLYLSLFVGFIGLMLLLAFMLEVFDLPQAFFSGRFRFIRAAQILTFFR